MISCLMEQLSPLGCIRHKRMFGADCVFLNGVMIGIVQDDEIFIKKPNHTDDDVCFSYQRQGKTVSLSYVLIDGAVLDDGDELVSLVRSFLGQDGE